MPTYDYKCDACGHAFELFQSMSADPVRKCPKCKKLKVKRLIGTGAGLIFKGSGFYITDYRDQSYTDKAKAESSNGQTKSDSASSDSSGDKPTETSKAAETAKPASEPKPAAASKSAAKPAVKPSRSKKSK